MIINCIFAIIYFRYKRALDRAPGTRTREECGLLLPILTKEKIFHELNLNRNVFIFHLIRIILMLHKYVKYKVFYQMDLIILQDLHIV